MDRRDSAIDTHLPAKVSELHRLFVGEEGHRERRVAASRVCSVHTVHRLPQRHRLGLCVCVCARACVCVVRWVGDCQVCVQNVVIAVVKWMHADQ
jgi:hypothetical protein